MYLIHTYINYVQIYVIIYVYMLNMYIYTIYVCVLDIYAIYMHVCILDVYIGYIYIKLFIFNLLRPNASSFNHDYTLFQNLQN